MNFGVTEGRGQHASRIKLSFGLIVLATMGCLTATTSAFAVDYPGPYVGTLITYSDISEVTTTPGDADPLYGMPELISPNTLDFDPNLYPFAAAAPTTDNTSSTLTMTVSSSTNDTLPDLAVDELFDYVFTGTPSGNEFVSATLFVYVHDAVTDDVLQFYTETVEHQFTGGPTQAGFDTVNIDVLLSSLATNEVKLVVQNVLQASVPADEGNVAAFIQKKDLQFSIVPEPASLALLGIGSLLMLGRSRRKAA